MSGAGFRSPGPPGPADALDPLAGRREELGLLRAAVERVRRERACEVVTVIGPAGAGKSRLALALAGAMAGEALVLRARCLPEAVGVPLWPLTRIVRQVPAALAAEAVAGQAHAELIIERLEAGRIEDRYWAAHALLRALARQRPLVVVFEDLHWAEPTLLDFVERLEDAAGRADDRAEGDGAPILLVCLARPELLDRRPDWAAGQRRTSTIRLAPLPDAASVELLDRLDRLQPAERGVLERASVEGAVFHLGAVVALTPPESRAGVPDALASLARQRLVRRWIAEHPGEEGFRFEHPLLREATYAAVRRRRAELHQGVAAWLAGRAGAEDELIGYHLEQACHDPGEQPGEQAGALRRAAAERLGSAGRRAQGLVDLVGAGASDLLGRAVALLPAGDPLRRELLPDLAASLAEPARYGHAEAVIEEGLALAGATRDRRLAARLRVEHAWLRFHMDPATELAAAIREIEQAVPALEEATDDRALARAWFAHGSCLFSLGRAEQAAVVLERGVRHARRARDRRAEVDLVWQLAGPLFWGPTPAGEAIGIARELRAQLPPVSQPEAFMRLIEAVFAAMLGRLADARRAYREAEARYHELGVRMEDVGAPQYSTRFQLLAGDLPVAVAQLQELCRVSAGRGDTAYLATSAGQLAEALYQQGRYADAWPATETSERNAAPDDFAAQMLWRGVRAKLLARRGAYQDAARLAREAVAIGEPSDYLFARGDSLRDLAEVLLLAGSRGDAMEAAKAAHALYTRKGDRVSAARVEHLMAGGHATRPRPEEQDQDEGTDEDQGKDEDRLRARAQRSVR